MAFIHGMGESGEQYTETSLWTNQSPSSDFNAQTITISDSISNYKYIAIDYCYNKSNTGVTSRVIYDVTDFKKAVKDGSTNHTISGLTIEGANNVNYARPVFYISDTSIAFGLSSTLNGSGTYAAGAIPLEILGLNELDHGKRFDETTLWTNNAPTSSFTGQEITLSDDVNNYDYIAVRYYFNTSSSTGSCVSTNLISISDLKKWTYNDSTKHNTGAISSEDASNNLFIRNVFYISSTKMRFSAANKVATNTYDNTVCIPYQIIGCKFA